MLCHRDRARLEIFTLLTLCGLETPNKPNPEHHEASACPIKGGLVILNRAWVMPESGVQSMRYSFRGFLALALVLVLCPMAGAQGASPAKRPRAADIGLEVGVLPAGLLDAITDVARVQVGQAPIIRGDNVRTGVTAILPHTAWV